MHKAAVALALAVCLQALNGAAAGGRPPTRAERIEALKAQIDEAGTVAEKIELERALAVLWVGEGTNEAPDTGRFLREAKRILDQYNEAAHHYSYLNLKVTYAQLQAAEIRSAMLMEVIEFDPREFQPPAGGQTEYWLNRLKQGAVWAYLNGMTSDAVTASLAVQARRANEEADALVRRMERTEEGRRCIPLAEWWRQVASAMEERAVVIPKLDPPPPSRLTAPAPEDAPEPDPAQPDNEFDAAETDRRPRVVSANRPFDSVEFIGTVTLPEPPAPPPAPPAPRRLPWLLGSVGVVLLAVGLLSMKRSKPARSSGG